GHSGAGTTVPKDLPGGAWQESAKKIEQRALAAAGWSDYADDRTRPESQEQIRDHFMGSVRLFSENFSKIGHGQRRIGRIRCWPLFSRSIHSDTASISRTVTRR